MRKDGYEIDIASYGYGFDDGLKRAKEDDLTTEKVAITFFVAFCLGCWLAWAISSRAYYRAGQIHAAMGEQHFFAVKQEIPATTITEWFDDREDQ